MTTAHKQILKQSTLLIVDDNSDLRNELKDLLSLYMFEIYEASNATDALKILKHKHPTILFSDIMMPKENGIELVKKVRKVNEHIPIVLISAHSEKALLFEALKLNLVDYLVKPVGLHKLKILLETLAEQIDKHSLLKVKLSDTLSFNKSHGVLYDGHDIVSLTKNEQRLLTLFLNHESSILEEEYIMNYIWKYESKTISALRNLVLRLRKKIGKELIESMHGQGYKFIHK